VAGYGSRGRGSWDHMGRAVKKGKGMEYHEDPVMTEMFEGEKKRKKKGAGKHILGSKVPFRLPGRIIERKAGGRRKRRKPRGKESCPGHFAKRA